MPSLITRGGRSVKAFGGRTSVSPDATSGIFALGNVTGGTTIRERYTYSNCTSTSSGVGAASANSYGGAAAGNGTRGIFQLGNSPASTASTTRNKYTYATNTSTACGVAVASAATSYKAAAGNSTRGIFGVGACLTATRNKYTYSNDTSASATAANASTTQQAATGNASVGIFQLGQTAANGRTTARNKYTYSNDTNTSATAIATCACNYGYAASAAGNSTRGIFAVGGYYLCCVGFYAFNYRNKYTYSNDTVVYSGVGQASVGSFRGAATGNSTRGIFALGVNSCGVAIATRNKFTYATCASTATGVASSTSSAYFGSAVSYGACVNCGA